MGTGDKRQGRESDYSPQSSAEVKMDELYLRSTIRLHAEVLSYVNKYRDNFTFYSTDQSLTLYSVDIESLKR
jgi:hypothetical protein